MGEGTEARFCDTKVIHPSSILDYVGTVKSPERSGWRTVAFVSPGLRRLFLQLSFTTKYKHTKQSDEVSELSDSASKCVDPDQWAGVQVQIPNRLTHGVTEFEPGLILGKIRGLPQKLA